MARDITTLVPWAGSNRTLAEQIGLEFDGLSHVTVLFAGGMSDVRYLKAPTILVNDLHRMVINLARVVKDAPSREWLIERLNRTAYHPDVLAQARKCCATMEGDLTADTNAWELAYHYFIAAWMSRNGMAGTQGELTSSYSIRYKDGGGDSATRFRNATAALEEWGQVMRRCTFVVEDCFDLIEKLRDDPKHGIYCDPPFPEVGKRYKHTFGESDHQRLAGRLAKFEHNQIVMRFYDHPMIRALYPESLWNWSLHEGRRQTNTPGPEVILRRKR